MASKKPILNLTYSDLLMTTEVILSHSFAYSHRDRSLIRMAIDHDFA